jgi:protein-S-isoprenylcysteine O-methyltransferase Ste14
VKSKVFVVVQFLLIATLALYADIWGETAQNILMVIGLIVGLWAIVTMRLKVSILPDVRDSQKLFTNGPYKYIRHPMYTAVLLITFAWVLQRFNIFSVCMWIILVLNLNLKLKFEESLLLRKFKKYSSYMKKTKRLIPFIY